MKFWQVFALMEPEQMLEVARFAEDVGFDGVMLADHAVVPQEIKSRYPYSATGEWQSDSKRYFPDCWASIGAIAAATKRLRIATGVYLLPLRNIFEVARATATLTILSGNRFIFGVGTGWMKEEFDIYGVGFHDRGKRYDEMLTALGKLWTGKMVEHHGNFIDFPALEISPAPSAPVPIYMGGNARIVLERTARVADGWIGSGNTPDQVPGILANLRALRTQAGRAHLPFETVIGLTTPHDVDTFRRLEAEGMTTGISGPFYVSLGASSTVDQKKRLMEDFARRFIEPCR